MELHTLFYRKSKKKPMRAIMTDSWQKCLNYQKAREPNVTGHHEIKRAEAGATVWKQKTCTIGGNKCAVPRITLHGTQRNGWIGKHGFQEHT